MRLEELLVICEAKKKNRKTGGKEKPKLISDVAREVSGNDTQKERDLLNGWEVVKTNGFKKAFRQHANDKRIVEAINDIIRFVINRDQKPPVTEYPAQYRIHPINQDKKIIDKYGDELLWSHLKGKKIGMLFRPLYDERKLVLSFIGTHQDLGWN